jgi:hypothetical protein
VALQERVDTFDPRGNYVTKMGVSVHPSLDELFLVEIKPVGLDITNFFEILGQVALFKLLDAPIEGFLVR